MVKPSDTVAFAEIGIDADARRALNAGLRGARNATMLRLIGNPRGSYDTDCRHPTNARIAAQMETADVGPFRATGIRPAVASLRAVLADVAEEAPEVHAAMSSAGMLCCRLVRGSRSAISNHAWGTAIDIRLDGKLDRRGDGRTQRGLLAVQPIFNRHKWFWGAAFRTEDAMHFEASDQLVREWAAEGALGALPDGAAYGAADDAAPDAVSFGDRGPEVETLQARLNFATGLDVDMDGIFGPATRAAVVEFQRMHGLSPDGIVGPRTMRALEDATHGHDL